MATHETKSLLVKSKSEILEVEIRRRGNYNEWQEIIIKDFFIKF